MKGQTVKAIKGIKESDDEEMEEEGEQHDEIDQSDVSIHGQPMSRSPYLAYIAQVLNFL